VREGVQEALEDTVLPSYKKTYKEYRLVKDAHQGVLSGSIYRVVLRCLHSDSRNSTSDEKLRAAFETFPKTGSRADG